MRRSTLVLTLIFILLAALTWFMQQPGNPITKVFSPAITVSPTSEVTFVINGKGPLNEISIRDTTGRTVVFTNENNNWAFKTDRVNLTDQTLANNAASQAVYLRIIKKFNTSPDPAGTGLNNPTYAISLVFSDGTKLSLRIGNVTVTKSGYYAATEDGHVYILGKDEVDALTNIFSQPPVQITVSPTAGIETETPLPVSTNGTGDLSPAKQP